MNLCYLDFGIKIPQRVRLNSRLIAIRTMLKTEAMDFDLEPRGIIPRNLKKINDSIVQRQLEFIIGHEFSHHFCGHLDTNKVLEKSLLRPLRGEPQGKFEKFYTRDQKEEFEADVLALKMLDVSPKIKDTYICEAIHFFIYLHLFEAISDSIFPSDGRYSKHPPSIERIWNIYSNFESEITSIKKDKLELLLKKREEEKNQLINDVGYNIERYENYASYYLDVPCTKWRGKELKDRVDF